jgi:hypothetical protein
MSKKPVHFFEIIWLIVAAACFMLGIKTAINQQISDSLIFFVFSALAITMFAFRRYLRKKNTSDH